MADEKELNESFTRIQKIKKNKKINKLFDALNFCLPNEINIKGLKYDLRKYSNNSKLAWKIFVLLTTSVLTNKVPQNEGNFKTILGGIYKVYTSINNYLLEYENAKITLILAEFLINKKIKPFLGKWHSKQINENFDTLTDEFRNELEKLQNDIKTNYLEQFSNLAKLYHRNNKIKKYINN